jgi:outer membrane protein TolC/ABC-type uncharacterized transport system substrate-binding protein
VISRCGALATVGCLLVCSAALAQDGGRPEIHFALVLDGPSERSAQIRAEFEREITEFFAFERTVRFDGSTEGDWTVTGVRAAVERALAAPEVDLVLALGPLSSHVLATAPSRPVPAVACFVIDAELQALPRRDGASGAANLTYLDEQYSVRRALEQLSSVVSFRSLVVLISPGVLEAVPALRDRAVQDAEALGGQLAFVPVTDSAAGAVAAIPAGADAALITPLLQLPRSELDALIAGLNRRKLPTFSAVGREEVERGVLAAFAPADDVVRRARRAATNAQRILGGEDPATIHVEFSRESQLTLNMRTAREIGFSPTWPVLTEAELVDAGGDVAGRALTLVSCVREALRADSEVRAARKRLEAGRESVRSARAPLLPQLGAAAAGTVIRKETAEASLGTQPERLVEGSIGWTQSLYSEELRSRWAIERHLHEGRAAEVRAAELDVTLEAATAYLDVLRAMTVAKVQRANLRLSLSNLDLARVRETIGASGRSDVHRWESEVATNRRSVLDADAAVEVARIELNRLLNRPLEEPFAAADVAFDDPDLITGEPRLFEYFANPRTFAAFRDFMVAEGWNASPELREIDASIAARRRAQTAARRSFWLPDVDLEGGLRYTFDESGAGSQDPPAPLTAAPSLGWSVELGLSLPIFTGFARHAALREATIDLERLDLERDAVADGIARGVRATLHLAGASFAGIEQAQAAAAAARSNLEIVTEAYGSGAASIITLIDAQNALLVAEQSAASAVYDFLADLMQVERSGGRFHFLEDAEARRAYFERLDSHYRQAGLTPGP